MLRVQRSEGGKEKRLTSWRRHGSYADVQGRVTAMLAHLDVAYWLIAMNTTAVVVIYLANDICTADDFAFSEVD